MDKTKIKIRELLPYIAFAILVIFLFYHLISTLFPGAELYLVKKETFFEYETLAGYIFRDEVPIYADGDVKITRRNGEKVAAGGIIGEVFDGGEKISDITADCAGWFYSDADGYEDSFSVSAALELTVWNFDATVNAVPSEKNDCIGKIAADYIWYFACKTRENDFKTGYTYAFDFDGIGVDMTLEKSDENDGACVLVFKCGELPSGFDFSREKTATVTSGVYSGAAVPTGAVYKKRDADCIYLFDEGFAREIKVNVIYDNGSECIVGCDTDIVGQNIIIGRGLYDGKGFK